jgi:aspartyl-tRNA synthetase
MLGFMKYILKEIKGIEFNEPFPRMTYADAMKYYGIDKPDIRFGIKMVELDGLVKGKGFGVFDNAEYVVGICAPGMGSINKNEITKLTTLAKSGDIGATGLIWIKAGPQPTSSVDKFYTPEVVFFFIQTNPL